MRARRVNRLWVAALFLGTPLFLGAPCGSGEGGPIAALRAEPAQVIYFAGGYYMKVNVYATVDQPAHAWELNLGWNTAILDHLFTSPAPESDDDGVFFHGPDLDEAAGTLGFADLRHGSSGLTGDSRIAEVWFVAWHGGTANVTIDGGLSTDEGEAFTVIANLNGTFPITP